MVGDLDEGCDHQRRLDGLGRLARFVGGFKTGTSVGSGSERDRCGRAPVWTSSGDREKRPGERRLVVALPSRLVCFVFGVALYACFRRAGEPVGGTAGRSRVPGSHRLNGVRCWGGLRSDGGDHVPFPRGAHGEGGRVGCSWVFGRLRGGWGTSRQVFRSREELEGPMEFPLSFGVAVVRWPFRDPHHAPLHFADCSCTWLCSFGVDRHLLARVCRRATRALMAAEKFAGRVAVITGGAGGIGCALARAFLRRGARVALADLDSEALDRALADLRGIGGEVVGVVTDVTSRESTRQLAEEVRRHFGAVHVVCNNAGVAVFGPLREARHEDWEFTMAVNFWGVVHGIETFLPWLIEQGAGGHIVNTASMAGLVGMEWLGIYSASKFAVVGLSEALYRELKPLGIGVSVLCPMMVDTRINENSVRLRPAALRAPGAEPVVPPAGAMQGSVIAPAEVAERVVRGIERGDFYILTHPEQRAILRRRAERLDRMFDPDLW